MIETTLINPEETITLSSTEETKVNGILSFQNLSNRTVKWSTAPLTSTNLGSTIEGKGERIFSKATTIYFSNKIIKTKMQCRSVEL